MGGENVTILSTLEDFKTKVGGSKKAIVKFTASWCGPCQKIAPVYNKLAGENTDILFCEVDVDDNQDTAEQEDVEAMPTFISYTDGKKGEVLQGADENSLVAAVKALKSK